MGIDLKPFYLELAVATPVLILVYVPDIEVANVFTDTTIPRKIRAAINPYSIAVLPDLSLKKRRLKLNSLNIVVALPI